MERVDKVQPIKSDNHVTTKFNTDYYVENELYTCVIRLENGFEAIGQVEENYQPKLTVEQKKNLAHQRALKYAEMHGYDLV
ncbi:hypothetical protein M3_0195 [Lysinibacillus phage vB_LfM_LysYB1]|nr:hypothetical protein M3_0195 [Lysinibacillus phage vB_LfM_LysYB1]WAB25293.1 hypothetical protein M5_0115 [Lysinibacillus phage vB_LfM_LysYB2]